ncbi:phosphatase PAP2 family protein [Affinibrenneria salicis]|uniref:Phosphatase PAP2 family protein n=1 Tax=Affinibrenneria salicis TaxID=2590031 RepID=A0A5J5FX12_9GAMM|nr:phosphatase PAP2 family protein [Affinibrenneria salicis]KAA8998226.1 phosphatase PAP2 family protein [Affinibrenneria salicis]
MRFSLSLLSCALLSLPVVAATPVDFSQVSAVVNTTTPASGSTTFVALEQTIAQDLRQTLKGDAATLTRDQLAHAGQSQHLADKAWLQASHYDFAPDANQQAGIALLKSFQSLPSALLAQNMATVTRINRDATQGQRTQALVDAEGIGYLYFLADAMGPRLGKAFLTAYNNGELSEAAALIKATEVSTSAAKKYFSYARPFLQEGNQIHLVPDSAVVQDNQPYSADGGAFPSGHTNTGYTDALLMAVMLPERYVELVDRGARYGYSRVVLGVHYPLDVMGSRMVAERNVAHYLNDAGYRALFEQAKGQLRQALEKECGMSLAQCARSAGEDDPYSAPAMRQFYQFTMTYNLPATPGASQPVAVPQGAEVLLESALPGLSAAQRRQVMAKTALADGYPLSGGQGEQNFWQRLNLHDAVLAARH